MGDFEGGKTSVEEVTADVMEETRQLELEVKPHNGSELLPSRDKTLMAEELLLMTEQRTWLLETE